MSSNIIGEENLQAQPEDSVQYIEVPVIEEVIRHVPKREVVEIEKRVPRYEYEWVEKIVEVPQIQWVEKHVEVPQIQEVVRYVPVKQVVEVPKEVVRYIPKIDVKIVEREVEVVGETIEVPKPYLVENKVVVPRYLDKEVPTVVAQRLHPIITESDTDFVDVELKEYNPQLIPVDVYIPRPVTRSLIAANKYEEHRVVDVPIAQYNALVKNLNTHLSDKDADAVYVRLSDGTIPMLHGLGSSIVPPTSNEWEKYHTKGQCHVIYTAGATTGTTTTSAYTTGGAYTTGAAYTTGGTYTTGGGTYTSGTYTTGMPTFSGTHGRTYSTQQYTTNAEGAFNLTRGAQGSSPHMSSGITKGGYKYSSYPSQQNFPTSTVQSSSRIIAAGA